jgi:nanoRNase/pAp phosphatase (c-di-AMP/oligoRNAs hydrolase)
MRMDLTPKQQTSEAIRQSETILITTGQHPSVDQVAAVIGLTMILRKFGKKVTAVITDSLPPSTNMLETNLVERDMRGLRDFILKLDVSKSEVDKLRYEVIDNKLNVFVTPFKGNFAPSDVTFDYGQAQMEYDLAIVLGVPTRARIDRVYEQNMSLFDRIPVINLDFHRSNENYGAVNLIEPNASSLCEMLVALAESLQGGIIDDQIATALLMGIIGSTDRFTAAHTTSKSLTVAAQMMAAGARQQAVVKALYKDGKGGGQNDRNQNKPSNEPRHDRNQDQRHERQTEPRAERQPQPVQQPAPQPLVQPEAAPVIEAEPVSTMPQMAEARNDMPLPIIDPGHIEISEPVEETQPHTTALPSMQPMADFAAASEILAQRQGDEHSESERT